MVEDMVDQPQNRTISWVSDEYKHHERDLGWYAGLFLLGALLVAWGLYTHNIISTLLFLLIIFTVYALSHRKPEKVTVKIHKDGVQLKDAFYPYASLKRFWILPHNDGELELTFETKSFLNRHLSVQLEQQNPESLREFLKLFLEEAQDYEENFIDHLVRRLKL